MPRSEARVTTDRSARYAKQLAAHMGRKIKADWSEETGHGTLVFGAGTATLEATPDALLLAVEGETENLPGLEDVVGRHLVRFGARDELVVEWRRDSGEAGHVHRNDEEPVEG
ncbi:DUF2218 domain-containing protein [Streptomyces sp. XY431]|uniref:DUF2218 domain-containing protein n=1 Tax=Streptomyces sp. XY431 TaxID=1415562 RepID=UPI0006AE7E69|nr:DUF2218 domain-containing protein [Streptomyces sp. XY431]